MSEMDICDYHAGERAERPWGSWSVLAVYPRAILKRIEVQPGCRLSLQGHQHREELWLVVQGTATVEIDGVERKLTEGESAQVPRMSPHRLSNATQELLVVAELQRGDILSEEDIERYEDDYHRAPEDEHAN